MTDFDLTTVQLFAALPADDLAKLQPQLREQRLAAGEILFHEGDTAVDAYVVTSGEVEILKETEERSVRLAVSKAGVLIGEMGLLAGEPRNATAKALTDAILIVIPNKTFNDIVDSSAPAMRALFDVFVRRWKEQELRVRQSERMAQLGVLTAGLAHEMNNPAAAVARGAEQLRPGIARLERELGRFQGELGVLATRESSPHLSALERADREETIEAALAALGVNDPWQLAADLVAAGLTEEDLERAGSGDDAAGLLKTLAARSEVEMLVDEVQEGAKRLSELVAALKSYSFLDQAPVQVTDIKRGLEDTLLILKSKLADVEVRREFAEDLPTISAFGSQLNQVWTNLIDNAAFAVQSLDDRPAVITLRAHREGDGHIVVEVEDNGPGIPDGVVGHIFEAFYTTKAPGSGTGIGLSSVYSIVVNDHRGAIDVASEPGSTVFRVKLPIAMGPGNT